ncbi:MAG: GGDEF domain-containing protein [Candidatus Omnitrophica bacterium]|nr:GGDEF domain-containing protein [Candidatus Omnitrophota bacterium]
MAGTKHRLSKIRKEAARLFSLERGIQKSVLILNLAALLGLLYLSLPTAFSSGIGPYQKILMGLLALFLAANYFQQVVVMRLRSQWAALEEQSAYDGLTRAFNRDSFEDIMEEEISRARRYKVPLSLCILDLDGFKTYNDTYGHPQGDRLLADFSARVLKAIRSADCLARFGGDEFCVLLPHTDLGNAEKFLNRMMTEVQEWMDISFSAGVTAFQPSDDGLAFISRADLALYQAKREGKNRIRSLLSESGREVLVNF